MPIEIVYESVDPQFSRPIQWSIRSLVLFSLEFFTPFLVSAIVEDNSAVWASRH